MTMEKRLSRHLRDAFKGSTCLFHRALRKHPIELWEHNVLETQPSLALARSAEIRLIALHETFCCDHPNKGYNMTRGGETASTGWKHSEKARQAISRSLIGRFVSNETRQKMSEIQIGKIISIQTREKYRLASLGRKQRLTRNGILGKAIHTQTKQKRRSPSAFASMLVLVELFNLTFQTMSSPSMKQFMTLP